MLVVSGIDHKIALTKGNDGVELRPGERMSFVFEQGAKGGGLEHATLDVIAHGWERSYKLSKVPPKTG